MRFVRIYFQTGVITARLSHQTDPPFGTVRVFGGTIRAPLLSEPEGRCSSQEKHSIGAMDAARRAMPGSSDQHAESKDERAGRCGFE